MTGEEYVEIGVHFLYGVIDPGSLEANNSKVVSQVFQKGVISFHMFCLLFRYFVPI